LRFAYGAIWKRRRSGLALSRTELAIMPDDELLTQDLSQAEIVEGSNVAEELQKIQTAVMHGTELVRQLMIYAGQERPP
jgi:hypothetical protein